MTPEFLVEDGIEDWVDGGVAIGQPLDQRVNPDRISAHLKPGYNLMMLFLKSFPDWGLLKV
jgi:hypothetical protein